MQPKTGLALLTWSALSAMMTVYAFVFAMGPHALVQKSLVPPAYAVILSGALDESKLEAQCKQDGGDPPRRGPDGHIDTFTLADWFGGGISKAMGQALGPLALGLGIGTVLTTACGIACTRRPKQA